ncbi:PKD domain-containing protein [Candidatus Pacearchaeota archaeon]|nr:PKD domain-containing protein [Candidatus Pacearchaeota archaeon]
MSLIHKQRRQEQFSVETEYSEVLFLTETAIAFRRKDLSNRAFVGQRILTVREEKQLANWLNGQEYDIVSQDTLDASVIAVSGVSAPNIAPEVRLTTRIDVVLPSGANNVMYDIIGSDVDIQDETPIPQLTRFWEQISGPGAATITFSNPSATAPNMTFPDPGHYVVRLTVTEPDEGLIGTDTMRIVVVQG